MPSAIASTIYLPPDETLAYFRAKGQYPISRKWWDVWQEEHVRGFTIAGVTDRAVLEDVRATLDKVKAEGGTLADWKKSVLPTLKQAVENGTAPPNILSGNRLRTIYQTNLRMARAAGKWTRIQDLKGDMPYLMYVALDDGRARELHALWGGLGSGGKPIILPVDHPFWRWFFPPNGWGCRCTVIQLSEADLIDFGYEVTSEARLAELGLPSRDATDIDKIPGRDFVRGDGIIERVPEGIDPGFAYNPGEHHMRGLVPRPLEGEPAEYPHLNQTAESAAILTSRPSDENSVLPKSSTADDALDAWAQATGVARGSAGFITDKTGQIIVIDDSFWLGSNGQLKIMKRDRHQYVRLIAQTLTDPDEIWYLWEEDDPEKRLPGTAPKKSKIIRRYVAQFDVEGETIPFVVVMEIGSDGWKSVTAFGGKRVALSKRRGGHLAYQRIVPDGDDP